MKDFAVEVVRITVRGLAVTFMYMFRSYTIDYTVSALFYRESGL